MPTLPTPFWRPGPANKARTGNKVPRAKPSRLQQVLEKALVRGIRTNPEAGWHVALQALNMPSDIDIELAEVRFVREAYKDDPEFRRKVDEARQAVATRRSKAATASVIDRVITEEVLRRLKEDPGLFEAAVSRRLDAIAELALRNRWSLQEILAKLEADLKRGAGGFTKSSRPPA